MIKGESDAKPAADGDKKKKKKSKATEPDPEPVVEEAPVEEAPKKKSKKSKEVSETTFHLLITSIKFLTLFVLGGIGTCD